MNQPHPATVVPTIHGDSVGHYEGDTLVIDTVGIKLGPYRMVDRFGTPYSQALHVVERYRLIDSEATKQALAEAEKEWPRVGGVDPNYKGKGLQLAFTVEDPGVFTMPWSATITYGRHPSQAWDERVCAENVAARLSSTTTSPTRTPIFRPPTSRISDQQPAVRFVA